MGGTVMERYGRWVALAGLALFVTIGVVLSGPNPLRVGAALVAVAAAPLLRRDNRWAAAPAVLSAAGVAVVCHGSAPNVGWFGLPVLAGWMATVAPTRVWAPFCAGAVLLLGIEWAVTEPDQGWAPWIAGTTLSAFGCHLGRRQRELADALRAAQAGLADAARTEERSRIAREVHDVVAHSLTVSLLHITGARLALSDGDPAEAAGALAEAERLGRAALGEVRQTVGMLRGGPVGSAPLPGAGQLADLVDGVRGVGAAVTFEVEGSLDALPATTGLAVYRILQEALTNAVRHAPGAATTARLVTTDRLVALTVDTAAPPGPPGTGVGLHSMRERAEALGGTCTAGPGGPGWRVHAELPVQTTAGVAQ